MTSGKPTLFNLHDRSEPQEARDEQGKAKQAKDVNISHAETPTRAWVLIINESAAIRELRELSACLIKQICIGIITIRTDFLWGV